MASTKTFYHFGAKSSPRRPPTHHLDSSSASSSAYTQSAHPSSELPTIIVLCMPATSTATPLQGYSPPATQAHQGPVQGALLLRINTARTRSVHSLTYVASNIDATTQAAPSSPVQRTHQVDSAVREVLSTPVQQISAYKGTATEEKMDILDRELEWSPSPSECSVFFAFSSSCFQVEFLVSGDSQSVTNVEGGG